MFATRTQSITIDCRPIANRTTNRNRNWNYYIVPIKCNRTRYKTHVSGQGARREQTARTILITFGETNRAIQKLKRRATIPKPRRRRQRRFNNDSVRPDDGFYRYRLKTRIEYRVFQSQKCRDSVTSDATLVGGVQIYRPSHQTIIIQVYNIYNSRLADKNPNGSETFSFCSEIVHKINLFDRKFVRVETVSGERARARCFGIIFKRTFVIYYCYLTTSYFFFFFRILNSVCDCFSIIFRSVFELS